MEKDNNFENKESNTQDDNIVSQTEDFDNLIKENFREMSYMLLNVHLEKMQISL